MTKRCVFTVIFDNYDKLNEINFKSDIRFICFTDNKDLNCKGWEIIYYSIENFLFIKENRKIKISPHLFLPDFDESLYIDGNIRVKRDPTPLFIKYLSGYNLAIPKHPIRNCIFDEKEEILAKRKYNSKQKELLEKHISEYRKSGMPTNFGLWENNIIFRRHNHPINFSLSEMWWNEFNKSVKRDQISLPFVLWSRGIEIINVDESPRYTNNYFEYELHNHLKTKNIIVLLKRISLIRKNQNKFYYFINYFFELIKNL